MTAATRAKGPFIPAPYGLVEASALQAMQLGEASAHQQQLVLKWIIEVAAGAYEFQYYPSDRDTAFALGRGFVGQQLVKLLHLNLSSLRRQEAHVETTTHPTQAR